MDFALLPRVTAYTRVAPALLLAAALGAAGLDENLRQYCQKMGDSPQG